MRCRKCGYRLWNLASRKCPECGTPFLPSDYEFVARSVQFHCPHCNHVYYGTTDLGHLEPKDFNCLSCREHIDMDEMVLTPAAGFTEKQTQVKGMPWLEWQERGPVNAWVAMIRHAFVEPGQLMRTTPVTSSTVQAWWFALLTVLVVLLAALPMLGFELLRTYVDLSSGSPVVGAVVRILGRRMAYLLVVALLPIVTLIGLWAWVRVTHGVLRVTGKTRGSLRRTCHAMCYSAGVTVLAVLPLYGPPLVVVSWIASAAAMVREAQRVSTVRAIAAVLVLPMVLIATTGAAYTWGVIPGTRPAELRGMATFWTERVLEDISLRRMLGSPRARHAIELGIDEYRFIVPGSNTTARHIRLGNTTLDALVRLPNDEKPAAIKHIAESLPVGVLAHRVGDFVFVHYNRSMKKFDQELWQIIMSPAPEANPSNPFGAIYVGLLNGKIVRIPLRSGAGELAKQNKLRAKHSLPPLPDPSRITHTKPALPSP